MEKKGSFRKATTCRRCCGLSDIKAGLHPVRAPVYSHLIIYDVISQPVGRDQPPGHLDRRRPQCSPSRTAAQGRQGDPVRLRLLRFLDLSRCCRRGRAVVVVCQSRFLTLRGTAFVDPKSYFHRYAKLSDEAAVATATSIWNRIENLVNLRENILLDATARRSYSGRRAKTTVTSRKWRAPVVAAKGLGADYAASAAFPAARPRCSQTCSRSSGFTRKPSMPASEAGLAIVGGGVRRQHARIGVARCAGFGLIWRMRRVASRPSMPGM